MGNKPLWLRILLDTIGVPTIIAFVIGVPAMIVFIQSIWNGLSPSERISVIVAGAVLVIALILFIYARTRKVLLVIPNLLQKIQDITFEGAMKIDVEFKNFEASFYQIIQLFDMDLSEYSTETENETDTKVNGLYEKFQDMLISSEKTNERIVNLLVKDIGLRDVLMRDKRYIATTNKLDKARRQIPTEEIASNVSGYLRKVEVIGSALPMCQFLATKEYAGILKMEADFVGIENKIKDGMLAQLAKVRQSILQYYKG